VKAIYVDLDVEETEALRARWEVWAGGTELVLLDSPYRSLLGPLGDDSRRPLGAEGRPLWATFCHCVPTFPLRIP
jgi:hypothetical protein